MSLKIVRDVNRDTAGQSLGEPDPKKMDEKMGLGEQRGGGPRGRSAQKMPNHNHRERCGEGRAVKRLQGVCWVWQNIRCWKKMGSFTTAGVEGVGTNFFS